jgi:hypothetical protein
MCPQLEAGIGDDETANKLAKPVFEMMSEKLAPSIRRSTIMSQDSRCLFCQQLPATARIKGGKPAKCPVCKGELLVASDITYRLVTAQEMVLEPRGLQSRSWKPAAILAIAGCLVLAVWLSKQFISRGNDSAKEIQVAIVPEPVARASIPVQAALPMAPAQARPIPAANNPDAAAARKPVLNARAATKPIPKNVWLFPSAKENQTNARTAVAKVLPAPSYSKWFMKQSRLFSYQTADSRSRLLEAREIDLDEPFPTSLSDKESIKKAKARIAKKIEDIRNLTKDDPDGFVKQIKDREDLSGLPFIMGEACRLPARAARTLLVSSHTVRRRLDVSKKGVLDGSYSSDIYTKDSGVRFWESMNSNQADNLPALEQILLVESASHRKLFMNNLQKIKGKTAARILAQRAIFDLDGDVRKAALDALKSRPPEDVEPFILQGMRYPWQQVVNNSAEALVKLNRTDLVPNLVDMLDRPDPDEPFLGGPNNKQLMLRELVRVNHHRNCLLCHPPAGGKDRVEGPVGAIPTPGEPMSPTSAYSRKSQNVVRADVTYLRQDFSVMLPVADSHPWPAEQRYDFFVRVRVLKGEEAMNFRNRTPAKETAYKTAIVQALKALTGEDAGYSAAAWRQALDPLLERAWRSPCKK